MRIQRTLLLIALALCSLISCSDSQDDTRKEAYVFLNQFFANAGDDDFIEDSIIYLSDTNTLSPPNLGDYDNTTDYLVDLLATDNKEYIQNQLRNINGINLKELKAKNVIVVPASQLEYTSDYVEYFKKNGIAEPEGLYKISTPIFSPNLDKAYFRIGYICGGHCGGTEDRYYVKENGKWMLKEVVGGSVY
ncbi:hypothetical protein [Cesiribacter sp. SM1]|uniref:hypothetical protein n=1 Tax=Cesiribacter sp. SM1 TaxID=2861196 RepID=UPI001CD50FB0|nr:hypothetical protein [Cesiribacter sp. SM1]